MINGEKSSFNNTVFGKRRNRTIEAILNNLYLNFDPVSSTSKSSSANLSVEQQQQQNSSDSNQVNMSKKAREELRKAEFLKVGQVNRE